MTDQDDPFGDISESLSQGADDEDTADEEETTQERTTPTDDTGASDSTTTAGQQSSSRTSASTATQTEEQSLDRPAFEFEEADQFAWYALPEVRDEYEAVRDFEVKRLLRDRGFSDVPQSELTNAALAVLAEHPEVWADKVEEIRRESG